VSGTAKQLWFTAPLQVEVRECPLAAPSAGEVLVKVRCSAISAGTELLVYRGQLPADVPLDANIAALQTATTYPMQYGYACVGEVVQVGAQVEREWLGRRVFAFQPHVSHFIATPANLIAIPDDIGDEAALFLANMETAVNLVQDGAPQLGEQVVVLGQGIVGVLLLQLLRQFPLHSLHVVEPLATRRSRAAQLGVASVVEPALLPALKQELGQRGADLCYEVSGSPHALNDAVSLSGYGSRIVIGSWYGNKAASLMLGGDAHRNRVQLITSQVSTIAPSLTGRWDKQRRFNVVWDQIRTLQPQQWIDARVPLTEAHALYRRLHEQGIAANALLQAVFVYP